MKLGLVLSQSTSGGASGPVNVLLSGDAQTGTDKLLVSGDAQTGTDKILTN